MAQTLASTSSSSSLESMNLPSFQRVAHHHHPVVTTAPTSSHVPLPGQSSRLPGVGGTGHSIPLIPHNIVRSVQHQHHFDEIIEELDSNSASSGQSPVDLMDVPEVQEYPSMEPIVIRGNGNMTLFGLSNTFNGEFPSVLVGRVSREEFEATLNRINNLLRQHHSTNAKLLLLGCLCCCCSFGCSLLWPTLALSKRTRTALEKLIASENHKLYNRLGLNWKLTKERCHSNYAFMEYVLVIEFLPKLHLYQPD